MRPLPLGSLITEDSITSIALDVNIEDEKHSMTSTLLVSCLKAILLIGSALMAYKLYRTGLYRLYPIFFAYFTFRIPNGIWPLFFDGASPTYQKIWISTEPIILTFYILMIRELYRLVLEKYKGLYTLGRWAMYLAMTVSVIISGLSLLPRIKPSAAQRSKMMAYVLATERGVDTALAIFIVLLLLFLSRYPVRLSRNVRTYAVIYSVFFLSNTFVVLMRSLFGLQHGRPGEHRIDGCGGRLRGGMAGPAVAARR